MKKVHKMRKQTGVHTVLGAGLASGVMLPSYIVYRHISITIGARVNQQVHYMELVAMLGRNRQNFYHGCENAIFRWEIFWVQFCDPLCSQWII